MSSPLLALLTLFVFSEPDVKWLSTVTAVPPEVVKLDRTPLRPLLKRDNGTPVTTTTEWPVRRAEILKAWTEFLGPMPERPKPEFEVIAIEELERCVRKRIRYECEVGIFVEAFLLVPKGVVTAPGIVGLHQTTARTIDEIAGVPGAGPNQQALGLRLAEAGFVVICPRNFLWENAPSLNDAVASFKRRHPQALGMRKMLYDAMRAVDILQSAPECRAGKVGAIGHSLGAKEVLYLAAFDDRIAAAVASEGGVTFASTNWDAPWYLGPAIRQPDCARNHHELLALVAPRPFLILGGEQGPGAADGVRSWKVIEPAQVVSKLLGQPVRVGLLNHGKGHSIPTDAYDKSVEWLRTYIRD